MANDRSKTPTLKGDPKAGDSFPGDPTTVDGPLGKRRRGVDHNDDDPTNIYDSQPLRTPPATIPRPGEPDFVREPATPIRVRSMKTPGQASSGAIPLPPDAQPRPQHQVKLRAISEIAKPTPQLSLGYLAPPRDPNAVRARRTRDFIVWGSVCVILACVVALGIWFIAK